MRTSQLFTKTRKQAPADETAKNAQLLIKAGYIYKNMAGVYTLLPLGLNVVSKITDIVRDEMNMIGGLEMQSAALQAEDVWIKTRWSDEVVDNWFKTKLKNDTELGLAFTHEEPMTVLMKEYLHSYKDLPAYPYDIRTVFRNELRAKSGILRGREFYWKALYSFSESKEQHDDFYKKISRAYTNIFTKVGLGEITHFTFASGGTFSKYSHEFQTICDAGEDIIYVSQEKGIAVNEEVLTDEVLTDLELNRDELIKSKAIEVGNIFSLGNKFSDPLELYFTDKTGKQKPIFMGSYGIGLTRLMGTVAEILSDEKGLVWPENIAPFRVIICRLGGDKEVARVADELYDNMQEQGIEVMYDDRDVRPGEKFTDADLLGIPHRVVISAKTVEAGRIEYKKRTENNASMISVDELNKVLAQTQ
jgi:prolyl-tRNA synthetase